MKNKCLFFCFFIFFTVFTVYSQSSSPIIRNIEAVSQPDSITLSWTLPSDAALADVKEFCVFRAKEAFSRPGQFSEDTFAGKVGPKDTSFTDKVTDSSEYYYAVIARMSDDRFFDIIIPSENVTIYGISLLIKESSPDKNKKEADDGIPEGLKEGALRKTPLPYLHLIEEDLSSENGYKSDETSVFTKKSYSPEFYIFEEDKLDNAVGDAYSLYLITEKCNSRNWEDATKDLEELLKTNHDKFITARIYFYLGESAFFTGDYKSAVNYFLRCEKVYPVLSKKWQQYSLDAFTLPDSSK